VDIFEDALPHGRGSEKDNGLSLQKGNGRGSEQGNSRSLQKGNRAALNYS